MKKLIAALGLGLVLLAGAALAQTGGLGAISTWPGAFATGGFLDFRGGPTSSVIRATGGTFTCTSNGNIVVPDTAVTTNSVVLMSAKTSAGSPAAAPGVSALTAGTSFSARCVTNDTSVYNYWVLG